MEIRADQVGKNSQLATSSEQVCSSRGKRARCIEQAQVIEILQRYEKIFNMRIVKERGVLNKNI